MSGTNDAALAAFIARKAGIVAALERIRAASDDHFFTSLDDVNWGHVTALAEHVGLLKRITDALYCEDEHASAPLTRVNRKRNTPKCPSVRA